MSKTIFHRKVGRKENIEKNSMNELEKKAKAHRKKQKYPTSIFPDYKKGIEKFNQMNATQDTQADATATTADASGGMGESKQVRYNRQRYMKESKETAEYMGYKDREDFLNWEPVDLCIGLDCNDDILDEYVYGYEENRVWIDEVAPSRYFVFVNQTDEKPAMKFTSFKKAKEWAENYWDEKYFWVFDDEDMNESVSSTGKSYEYKGNVIVVTDDGCFIKGNDKKFPTTTEAEEYIDSLSESLTEGVNSRGGCDIMIVQDVYQDTSDGNMENDKLLTTTEYPVLLSELPSNILDIIEKRGPYREHVHKGDSMRNWELGNYILHLYEKKAYEDFKKYQKADDRADYRLLDAIVVNPDAFPASIGALRKKLGKMLLPPAGYSTRRNESYLYDDDNMSELEKDIEHTNLYGGDPTYCRTCGERLTYDEDGNSLCPECDAMEFEARKWENAQAPWKRVGTTKLDLSDYYYDCNDVVDAIVLERGNEVMYVFGKDEHIIETNDVNESTSKTINIRERLLEMDNSTYNTLGLLSLYESKNWSKDDKKKIAKMIYENASMEHIYKFLYENDSVDSGMSIDEKVKDATNNYKNTNGSYVYETQQDASKAKSLLSSHGYEVSDERTKDGKIRVSAVKKNDAPTML